MLLPRETARSATPMDKKSFSGKYYPLWLLLQGLSRLPLRVLYGLAWVIFVGTFYGPGYRKKVVFTNLRNSFPDKSPAEIMQLAKGFYRHFSEIVVEILKQGSISKGELLRRVSFVNSELVLQYVGQGKPVILMGGHLANWEWLSLSVSAYFPFPADGVYKPLSNPFFEDWLLHIRSRFGVRMVKTKDTLREFIRRKQEPRVIGLLSDQTPPGGEIQYWTTFLQQDTPFFVGTEKLAKSFNYPVVFLGMKRLRQGHYEVTFEPLYDGAAPLASDGFPLTEFFVRKMEDWIQTHPTDYLWTHRRWKNRRLSEPELD